MDSFGLTEADDYKDKAQALERFYLIRAAYRRGDETMGVLAMYEQAARNAGATSEELAATPEHIAWRIPA